MGRRDGTETLANVLLAFLEQRTWRQAELARRVGVERRQLVRVLDNLTRAGFDIHREEEHPDVYWSVPKHWFPGGVAFSGEDVSDLVRVLQLAPQSKKRDRLLSWISACATGVGSNEGHVVTRVLSPAEEASLTVLQQSAEQKIAANVRYYTLSRGDIAWRFLSVHRILLDRGRFVALCHRDDRLKWFRLDGVISAELSRQEPFRDTEAAEVDRLLNESVDGYHSGAPAIRCTFRVNLQDARWVRTQVQLPCEIKEEGGEMVFTAVTAGLLSLARFLVGLGRAARVDTPELRKLVVELARGALAMHAEPLVSEGKPEHSSGGHIQPAE